MHQIRTDYSQTVVEVNDRLAVTWITIVDQDTPVLHRYYKISKLPAANWSELIGKEVRPHSDLVYMGGFHQRYVRLEGWVEWEQVCIDSPIPKPRDGVLYTWLWARGQWYKESFPKCPRCYRWHNPEFPECGTCGYCHRPTSKCK